MLAKAATAALLGIDAFRVDLEVDLEIGRASCRERV